MSNAPASPDDFGDDDPFADALTPKAAREIERRMNIHRLQNEANELADGQLTGFSSEEAPAEITEQFWQNIVDFEKAPLVTTHQKLAVAGIEVPADTELNDADLHDTLWEIIEWMARNNTVLYQTDHLSDRELYVWLRDDWFHEPGADMPGMTCHTSPIGSCGEDDMVIYHRFYADESERADWLRDYPDDEMPPREKLPFDRDRFLLPSRLHQEDRRWRENQRHNEDEL